MLFYGQTLKCLVFILAGSYALLKKNPHGLFYVLKIKPEEVHNETIS